MENLPLEFVEKHDGDVVQSKHWKVLIVDDDQDVHTVTELVMHGVEILERGVEFLHAYSGVQAEEVLSENPDTAVILLDVVMESENAGLKFVQYVRETLKLLGVRIILRTGQPGYAPEYEAIRDYDINDYRTKSELSYARLLTSLTSAIRSFVQMKSMLDSNNNLELLIQSAPELLAKESLSDFEASIFQVLNNIFSMPVTGLCIQIAPNANHQPQFELRHATGSWSTISEEQVANNLEGVTDQIEQDLIQLLKDSIKRRSNHFSAIGFSLYIHGRDNVDMVLLVNTKDVDIQTRLLEVFGITTAMGYQNVLLVSKLRNLAYKDGLTGLLNRSGIIQAINHVRYNKTPMQAICLIDIEGFGELNEVLGHNYGDALLESVADRLSSCFDTPVICARVGADGFILLGQQETLSPEVIEMVFSKPFTVQGQSKYVRIVSGFVRLDEVHGDGADIIKDAHIAVKLAKMQKQNRFAYYHPKMESDNRSKVILLEDLQRSLEKNELEVYYQPQVHIPSARVSGLEALIRWPRGDGSFIPPGIFIPLAEQSGLIVDIGDWLINQVFNQVNVWNSMKLTGFRVAINISMRQFYNPHFIGFLGQALKKHHISPESIELEVTESMAMNDVDEVIAQLSKMKNMGFKIALDDFGTGFSSLSHLQNLPIDRIKIDRAFVSTIHEVEKQRAIAQTIVRMGQSLGLELIAEGVEEDSQSVVLVELGCPEAQGYLYGKPMNVKGATDWLVSKNNESKI